MSEQKYYVVWSGHIPGIYTNWKEAEKQVRRVPKAKFKSFATLGKAQVAFTQQEHVTIEEERPRVRKRSGKICKPRVREWWEVIWG